MARRSNNIEVAIVGDADFRAARREASKAFDRIESEGKDAADDIERAFDRIDIDPEGAEQFGDRLVAEGERGADGITNALGSIDFDNIGSQGLDSLTGALAAAGPWAAAAGGIAVVFGDELLSGFQRAFTRRRSEVIRAITTGASEQELAVAGQAAGEAYSSGFGESMPQLQADADELVRILGDIVNEADFEPMVKQASVLSDILGVEVPEAALLARRSVKQGLAADWQDAFDDMIGVTQEFGQTGVEALDILEEFGSNFARFELDGGQAVRFVAAAFEDGLIPTVDRAGEIFEEFTTRIVDADAQDAISELGLSFEQLQRDVAAGGDAANEAMQDVVKALLNVEDANDRARLANIIFGQSFEQVTDQGELLTRIMALLNSESDAYAGKSKDVADSLEDQQTAFQELQRDVEQAANQLAEFLDQQGDEGFFELGRSVRKAGEDLLDFVGITSGATVEMEGLAGELDVSARSSGTFGDAVDGASNEVNELRSEMERLKGFGPDKLMRDIANSVDEVRTSLDNGADAAVGFSGQIDISTQEGRRLQSQLERLAERLITASGKFDSGELSAYDFARAQQTAAADVAAAGRSAGLSASQVQGLIDKYLNIKGIGDLSTRVTVDFDGSFALNEMNRFIRLRDNIRSVGSTSTRTSARVSSSTSRVPVNVRAKGGPTTGLTVVGEQGPELLDLGTRRAFVHNNTDTRRMLSSGSGAAGKQQAVIIRIDSAGSRIDDVLVEVLRKSIANRGGTVQAVLG